MTPEDRSLWITTRVEAVRSHMPPMFAAAEVDHPDVLTWCADPTRNLMLTGSIGTGKTHQAWACWPYLIGLGWVGSWHALTEQEFLDAHLPGGDREMGHRALGADVLLLDELGNATLSDWSRSRLTGLIDHRWQHKKPMILTTNKSPADVKAHLGERALSRLAHSLTTVRMIGSDRRTA